MKTDFTIKDLVIKLLQAKDINKPLNAIYNGEPDYMLTYDLSKATIEYDNKGNPYLLLDSPLKS